MPRLSLLSVLLVSSLSSALCAPNTLNVYSPSSNRDCSAPWLVDYVGPDPTQPNPTAPVCTPTLCANLSYVENQQNICSSDANEAGLTTSFRSLFPPTAYLLIRSAYLSQDVAPSPICAPAGTTMPYAVSALLLDACIVDPPDRTGVTTSSFRFVKPANPTTATQVTANIYSTNTVCSGAPSSTQTFVIGRCQPDPNEAQTGFASQSYFLVSGTANPSAPTSGTANPSAPTSATANPSAPTSAPTSLPGTTRSPVVTTRRPAGTNAAATIVNSFSVGVAMIMTSSLALMMRLLA